MTELTIEEVKSWVAYADAENNYHLKYSPEYRLYAFALTLHTQFQQEREGREKLVKAMRKAMGQLNNLERMVPQTELPTEIWIGLELAIRHPELPLSPLFHTPAPQAQTEATPDSGGGL